jgi:hypothetical protein
MNLTSIFSHINWLGVVVVTILSFPLGALWHSKLMFGKAWMEDNNLTPEKAKSTHPAVLFGLTAVFHFVAVMVLAGLIDANSTVLEAFEKGVVVSIWAFAALGGTYLFAARPIRLLLIDGGFYVVFLSLAGLILGIW